MSEKLPDTIPSVDWEALEKAIINNDLTKLTPEEKVRHYAAVCHSLGLNPATQPFGYLQLNGKLTLYALKGAGDQLRRLYRVSVTVSPPVMQDGICTVIATATMPDGRTDSDAGCVSVGTLRGDALANAILKTITKAKRRVTLSICGLGMLDETEIETISNARVAAQPPAPESEEETEQMLIQADTLQDPTPKTREPEQTPIQVSRTPQPDESADPQVERMRTALGRLAEAEQSSRLAVMADYIRERGWKVKPQDLAIWPAKFKDDFEQEITERLKAPRVPA